jgi:hypothetical protein
MTLVRPGSASFSSTTGNVIWDFMYSLSFGLRLMVEMKQPATPVKAWLAGGGAGKVCQLAHFYRNGWGTAE